MLEILKKNNNNYVAKPIKNLDIITTKYQTKIEYQEDGTKIERRIPKKVNVTKMVNETKKLVKQDIAREKIEELKSIYTE